MGLIESDEGKLYIVSREVWAKQELKRMQEMEKPNVFSSGTGFGGDVNYLMDWMNIGQKDLEHLREKYQPQDYTINYRDMMRYNQIERKKHLKIKNIMKKLKSFKKFRTYHDTYMNK